MKIILKPMGAVLLLAAFVALTFFALRKRESAASSTVPLAPTAPSTVSSGAGDVAARLVGNADFAGGDGVLPGWELNPSADKRMHVAGDITVFQSAPSSLRLWTEPGSGQVTGRAGSELFKDLPNYAGRSLTFSVNLCKRGRWNRAEAVVQLLNKDWSSNTYVIVASFAGQRDGEWRTAMATIPIDDKAYAGVIGLVGDGEGTLNMDDLRVTVAP